MRHLKVQWFILWCQTRIFLLYCTKISSVDHSLAMYSLMRLEPDRIFVYLLQFGGDLGWALGKSWEIFICLQALFLAPNPNPLCVSPRSLLDALHQGDKLELDCPFMLLHSVSWG